MYVCKIDGEIISLLSAIESIEAIEDFYHRKYEDVITAIDTHDQSGYVQFNAIVNDSIVDSIKLFHS